MMPVLLAPDFDGNKWTCPRCGATLACVVNADTFDLSSMEERIVAALELPRGFVFHKEFDLWLKPGKSLPFQRGLQNRTQRQELRDFRCGQLERAASKNDVASIGSATMDIRGINQRRKEASAPLREEAKPELLHSDRLPARIECANRQCKKVLRLPSVRGVITRHNRT